MQKFCKQKPLNVASRKIAKDAGKLFRQVNMRGTPRKSATHFSAVKRVSELFFRSLLKRSAMVAVGQRRGAILQTYEAICVTEASR